ncbi:MAG: cytoplasmic protein, partial [Deltaproteobacteria bacterium]|nr:cytoplasmic protein [Deltaproteobacteria bacterium]
NGPSGGSLEDVSSRDTVILSDDPVAADAMAATLFGRDPGRISFIKLADKWGLGTSKFAELDGKKVVL